LLDKEIVENLKEYLIQQIAKRFSILKIKITFKLFLYTYIAMINAHFFLRDKKGEAWKSDVWKCCFSSVSILARTDVKIAQFLRSFAI